MERESLRAARGRPLRRTEAECSGFSVRNSTPHFPRIGFPETVPLFPPECSVFQKFRDFPKESFLPDFEGLRRTPSFQSTDDVRAEIYCKRRPFHTGNSSIPPATKDRLSGKRVSHILSAAPPFLFRDKGSCFGEPIRVRRLNRKARDFPVRTRKITQKMQDFQPRLVPGFQKRKKYIFPQSQRQIRRTQRKKRHLSQTLQNELYENRKSHHSEQK